MWKTTAIAVVCATVLRKLQTHFAKLHHRKANEGRSLSSPDEVGAAAFTLTNSKHIQLYCRRWGTPESAKAAVILVHSQLLDSRYFRRLAEDLVAAEYVCYGFDLTGFGKSGCQGPRSHIESFHDYLDDLGTVVSHIQSDNSALPILMYGEDLGATCCLAYTMDHPDIITAVAAASPKLQSQEANTGIWKILANIYPSFPGPLETVEYEIGGLFEDAEVIVVAHENFQILNPGSIQKINEISKLCNFVKENIQSLSTPLLLLQAHDDPRSKPELTEQLKMNSTSEESYIRVYRDAKHGLLHREEESSRSIHKDIQAFFQKQFLEHQKDKALSQ